MSKKPKVIKDYDKLDEEIVQQVKLAYPEGFREHIIKFIGPKGNKVSALPFEANDKHYLIRMTPGQAKRIIANDDDYDANDILKDAIKEEYLKKFK